MNGVIPPAAPWSWGGGAGVSWFGPSSSNKMSFCTMASESWAQSCNLLVKYFCNHRIIVGRGHTDHLVQPPVQCRIGPEFSFQASVNASLDQVRLQYCWLGLLGHECFPHSQSSSRILSPNPNSFVFCACNWQCQEKKTVK